MRLPQKNKLTTAWLLVMVLHSCRSSRYSHLTIVDSTIKNFINEEERFWSDINSSTNRQTANATLDRLYTYFDSNLNQPDMGSVDAVRTINEEFAEQIDKIKQHQRSATRWLTDKKYEEAQQNCDNILNTIPNELSEVFEFSKRPEFLTYIRENSDFCQTNKRFVTPGVEDLNLQNVVMDFYITVAEALTKGYMTIQMAYMVQGAKSQRSFIVTLFFFCIFTQFIRLYSFLFLDLQRKNTKENPLSFGHPLCHNIKRLKRM